MKLLSISSINFFQHQCVKSVSIWKYSRLHFSRNFLHLDWIRRDAEYLSVFGPNAGKCRKNADQNDSQYTHFLCSACHGSNWWRTSWNLSSVLINFFSCMPVCRDIPHSFHILIFKMPKIQRTEASFSIAT